MRSKGRKESLSDSRDLDGSYDQLTASSSSHFAVLACLQSSDTDGFSFMGYCGIAEILRVPDVRDAPLSRTWGKDHDILVMIGVGAGTGLGMEIPADLHGVPWAWSKVGI
ncbi:hypothetical protein TURU_131143 [Turdus rufiventris]|nr:hypothetical protein TURU_131143 [Turdus rufiventris]